MKYDLKYLSVPLPEEIQRVKEFGDFASADIAIDFVDKRTSAGIKRTFDN